MTQEFINTIISTVASQVLMRKADIDAFAEWIRKGNIDDEYAELEIAFAHGNSVDMMNFSMSAFDKFTA